MAAEKSHTKLTQRRRISHASKGIGSNSRVAISSSLAASSALASSSTSTRSSSCTFPPCSPLASPSISSPSQESPQQSQSRQPQQPSEPNIRPINSHGFKRQEQRKCSNPTLATGNADAIQRPKRCVSAFLFYSKHRRGVLQRKNPLEKLNFGDTSKRISSEWKEMSKEERLPFESLAVADRIRYASELSAFLHSFGLNERNRHTKTKDTSESVEEILTKSGSNSIMSTPAVTFKQKKREGSSYSHQLSEKLTRQRKSLMEWAKLKAAEHTASQFRNRKRKATGTISPAQETPAVNTKSAESSLSKQKQRGSEQSRGHSDGRAVPLSEKKARTTVKKTKRSFNHYCSFCHKGFRFTTNWRSHERTHTGEKVFMCEWQGCKKRFAHPASLQAHIAKHQGIKPYSCSQPSCTKKFANRSNLNRHLRKIHGLNTKGKKIKVDLNGKSK